MKQQHPIQLKILFDLLFSQSLRFSEMKPIEMESTQFMFHMKKLIEAGLVVKNEETYELTDAGKEFANRLDVEQIEKAEQAKVTTVLCCIRGKCENKEYLLYKRLKNPFFGCQGFPTKKALFGADLETTAIEGLKKETGMEPSENPHLFAVRHYLINSPDKELLEDKLMHAYLFTDPNGELDPGMEGEYFWIAKKDIKKTITKPQEEFWEFFEALESYNGKLTFKEITTTTENF